MSKSTCVEECINNYVRLAIYITMNKTHDKKPTAI